MQSVGAADKNENTLNIGFTLSLKGNDFDVNRSNYTTHTEIIGQSFLPLVQYLRNGKVIPSAAKRWQIENKNRRIRFFLRDDLYWSDGSPVVANDFIRGLKRALLDNKKEASLLRGLKGWKNFYKTRDISHLGLSAPNKHEIIVDMVKPNAIDFRAFASIQTMAISEKDITEDKDKLWAESKARLSYGPYKIASISENEIILVKNKYFPKLNDKMYDRIVYYGDVNRRNFEKYTAGQLDILMGPKGKQLRWINKNFSEEIINIGSPRVYALYRSIKSSKKISKKILSALSSSIDRTQLSKNIFGKTAGPLYGVLPPGIGGYPGLQALEPKIQGYSTLLEQAKQIISEQGYSETNPVKISLVIAKNVPGYTEIGKFIESNWNRINIEVNISYVENFSDSLNLFKDNAHDFVMTAYVPDSGGIFQYLLILDTFQNITNQKNDAKYLELLNLARQGLYYQNFNDYVTDTDRYIVDNFYLVPLIFNNLSAIVKPTIGNIEAATKGSMPRFYVNKLLPPNKSSK
jgi:oligopeptide transport system substrate-binding protein